MKNWHMSSLFLLILTFHPLPTLSNNTINLKITPTNLEIPYGMVHQNITFMAESDVDGSFTYLLYLIYNSQKLVWNTGSGNWSSNELVSIPMNNLQVALYIYNITLTNTYDTVTIEFEVSVTETSETIPNDLGQDIVFNEVPNSPNYVVNTLGNVIQWIAFAINPTDYSIYDDVTNTQNGEWESGVPIITNIDGYGIGEHTTTLVLNNADSVSIRHNVHFNVTDIVSSVIVSTSEELVFNIKILIVLGILIIIIVLLYSIGKIRK
ncbi:MAG: hypothetical protein GPJ54_14280 [Candidatus Heimdallarchaeota archaeon]|nr:hypothetical protein [Candidatus Heimdallarchaeota archaeon]